MEQESFDLANKVSAKLMNEGYIVFSPISHSHPIAESQKLPGTWDFWQKFDEAFIEWCDEVWVIQHPMTEQSKLVYNIRSVFVCQGCLSLIGSCLPCLSRGMWHYLHI